MPPQSEAIVPVSPGEAAASAALVVAKGFLGAAKRHPKLSGTYIFGLLMMLLGTGFKVSETQQVAFEDGMSQVNFDEELLSAYQGVQRADQQYRMRKGWFSCDGPCTAAWNELKHREATFNGVKAREAAATSDVKATVGIMSQYGVQETRDLFWEKFQGGKDFAKRQSMWDMLWIAMSSGGGRREESALVPVLRVIAQLLFNFTLGLCGALVVFIYKLWGVITTYQADPVSAVAFWVMASCAAFSMVATYLGLMFGTAGTAVYSMAKAAEANARLEGNQPRGQRPIGYARQQQYGQRAHYQ